MGHKRAMLGLKWAKLVQVWVQETINGVKVRTLDLIPQDSPKGSFIMGAWNWASGVECVVAGMSM